MTREELLAQDQQVRDRLSARDLDVNFLVSAGAGAGKTTLTVERAFHVLLDERAGVRPEEIVMITFTRKAATEMKERMSKRLRAAAANAEDPEMARRCRELMRKLPEMQISTIHAFCQRVLSEYPLASGIGFAPRFEAEDGGPESRSRQFFEQAWSSGRCPRSVQAGIMDKTLLDAFETLNGRAQVEPQFLDVDTEAGRALAQETLAKCKSLLERFRSALGDAAPSTFHYTLEDALRAGEAVTDGALLNAARRICMKGSAAREWMGKNSRKTPDKACEALDVFLNDGGSPAAKEAMTALFDEARGAKAADRRGFLLERLDRLPAEYRAAAELVERLPEEGELEALRENIDVLLHGIVMGEAVRLRDAYAEERRRDHVVSLEDMLTLTARLVRERSDVRQKLHERYKVFFVDEYQDTDPIQTDILFAITAEKYDPDWHKCVPRPGSLFLVGDPKQGIYRFRGADITLWQEAVEAIRATGGEVVTLSRNFRSTQEICDAVTRVFGAGGALCMAESRAQAAYSEMVANRGAMGVPAIYTHAIPASSREGHALAARRIAAFIRQRVDAGQNEYRDFLLLSYNREKEMAYADELRRLHIPVKFDGALPSDAYPALRLLDLRVQAVCHPFDETLSFRALCECGGVTPEEWDLFRMLVSRLPEETRLGAYRDTRSLMGHVKELEELLPDTEAVRRVLRALAMLDHDRVLSQSRTPCAFLEEVVEKGEGLFTREQDAGDFQNGYAALAQTIGQIRARAPRQFVDMAEMLSTMAQAELDRMPTVRADDDLVRLMNLHKAKGLEGRVVIFLPGNAPRRPADRCVERGDGAQRGWFVVGGNNAPQYAPPDWAQHQEEESQILNAERVRLKYVALTRAEDEVHVFSLAPGRGSSDVWKEFGALGIPSPDADAPDDLYADAALPAYDPLAEQEARREQEELQGRLGEILRSRVKSVRPSDLDEGHLAKEAPGAQGADDAPLRGPGGPLWGTLVHRAAELSVAQGVFTEDAIGAAVRQAAEEQFRTELMSKEDRHALAIGSAVASLEEIRAYLARAAASSLSFMADPASEFRRLLEGAQCYPEMPFTVSATSADGAFFECLRALTGAKGEERIEISGVIDLALRYPNGTWRVLDYKTDRRLPGDGDAAGFHARLLGEYGPQLRLYRLVLEKLSGEAVTDVMLVSIYDGGVLLRV